MGLLDSLGKIAANTPAGLITSALSTVLDRILPEDAATRQAAAIEVMKLQAEGTFEQKADLQTQTAQIDVNKAEAQSDGLFKGGWRPATGWMCVVGLGLQLTVMPIASWTVQAITGHPLPPLPAMDTQTMMGLLVPLLGLGAYRTAEKLQGKA